MKWFAPHPGADGRLERQCLSTSSSWPPRNASNNTSQSKLQESVLDNEYMSDAWPAPSDQIFVGSRLGGAVRLGARTAGRPAFDGSVGRGFAGVIYSKSARCSLACATRPPLSGFPVAIPQCEPRVRVVALLRQTVLLRSAAGAREPDRAYSVPEGIPSTPCR